MDHNVIEITGIIAVFGMPVLIALIVMLYISKQKRDKYHMIETMVKNGQPAPDYIFKDNGAPEESSMQMLRNGLIYIAIGIGLAIALWGFGLNDAIGIASIPALVGCAYLVAYFVARGKEKAQTGKSESDNTL